MPQYPIKNLKENVYAEKTLVITYNYRKERSVQPEILKEPQKLFSITLPTGNAIG